MAHARYGRLAWAALVPAGDPARPRRLRDHAAAATRARRRAGALARLSAGAAADLLRRRRQAASRSGRSVRNPELAAFLERHRRARAGSFLHRRRTRRRSSPTVQRRRAQSVADDGRPTSPPTRRKSGRRSAARYRGYRICGMGPPSSGATTRVRDPEAARAVRHARARARQSPVAWHLIAESMRLAYADREPISAIPISCRCRSPG